MNYFQKIPDFDFKKYLHFLALCLFLNLVKIKIFKDFSKIYEYVWFFSSNISLKHLISILFIA